MRLQRDGLAGAGRAGDQAVAVGKRRQQREDLVAALCNRQSVGHAATLPHMPRARDARGRRSSSRADGTSVAQPIPARDAAVPTTPDGKTVTLSGDRAI